MKKYNYQKKKLWKEIKNIDNQIIKCFRNNFVFNFFFNLIV